MALTWYGNQSDDEGRNLGRLAVVGPLLEEMNVAEIIDQHLPPDPQLEFSYGRVLSLLVAARLYSPVALSKVTEWARQSGADILWDIPLEKINDDRLGRALDRFFEQRHSILATLAMHVAERFEVCLDELHYDPTHLLFHGDYAGSQPRPPIQEENGSVRSNGQAAPAHITAGRRVPDAGTHALMIHAGLCVAVDEFGGVPVFGHAIGGNNNGHGAIAEQYALLRKHLPVQRLLMISDRGTFSARHLGRLHTDGFFSLCSVRWDDYQPLFQAHRQQLAWKRASYLSIEQQRRRTTNSSLPLEHYELAEVQHQLKDRDSGQSIPCRVIFVSSTAGQKAARKARKKAIAQIQKGLQKLAESVSKGCRNTDPTSVARRANKVFGEKSAAKYFQYQMVPLTAAERSKLPCPRPGCRTPKHRLEFTFDAEAARGDEVYDGISVLVTTVPCSQASADSLFGKFKQQNECDLAHHQWKTPLAVHPLFLKSPKRVEALVFLLMIALTAYQLLQRRYRQAVPADASAKERRTTTETILRAFSQYFLRIERSRYGRIVHPTRLADRQRTILAHLGFPTPAQILYRRLPRSPPQ